MKVRGKQREWNGKMIVELFSGWSAEASPTTANAKELVPNIDLE